MTFMNEAVTILIPCYNGQKYLERCLDSCVKQTYQNLQILIVNDGSNDESQNIIEAYIQKYPNISLINQTNSGLAKTRNVLIENAQTKYGFFLDADDWIEPDCIEYFMSYQNGYDLIINSTYINKQKKQKRFYITNKINKQTNNQSYLVNNTAFAWNILFNINYFKNNNLWFLSDAPFMEDILLTYLIYKNKNIKFLNNPKYHYWYNNSSLSRSNINKEKINHSIIQLKYFYDLIESRNFKEYPRAINDQLAFYHSVVFAYIQFQSKISKKERKFFKFKLKNLEAKNLKIRFPKCYWKFWFFLVYRLFGY